MSHTFDTSAPPQLFSVSINVVHSKDGGTLSVSKEMMILRAKDELERRLRNAIPDDHRCSLATADKHGGIAQ